VGDARECLGLGRCEGVQFCLEDGTGYDECACEANPLVNNPQPEDQATDDGGSSEDAASTDTHGGAGVSDDAAPSEDEAPAANETPGNDEVPDETLSTDESITDESITDESITDESVTDESITDDDITDESITDDDITDESITDDDITDDDITDESITDDDITDESITDDDITDDDITDDDITDDDITDDDITDDDITDESITDDDITDDDITDESITDDDITDDGPPPVEPGMGSVVLFLVDQSSSMFSPSASEYGSSAQFGEAPDNWEAVRMALGTLEPAVEGLEVGLMSYTGENDGTCPFTQLILEPGVSTPASVTRTLPTSERGAPPFTGQTPTGEALEIAVDALLTSDLQGDKHVIVITDGDPDTCLHPDPQCGQDFTVSIAQAAAALGVTTHVVGLTDGVGVPFLESLAYAGQSRPVPPPLSASQQDCLARQTGSMGGTFDPNNWRASALASYADDGTSFAEELAFTPQSEAELADTLQSLLNSIRTGE
jgi:hypothetical protein